MKEARTELTPKELYKEAVRSGIERATALRTLPEWFKEHPDFAEHDTLETLMRGAAQAQEELLEKIATDPAYVGVVDVVNFDGKKAEIIMSR